MRGIAGYGRYDDDPGYVACPFAKSDMSPCVARDGKLALSSGSREVCVGCAHPPAHLMKDLAEDGPYPPAKGKGAGDPVAVAEKFKRMVREATEPLVAQIEEKKNADLRDQQVDTGH